MTYRKEHLTMPGPDFRRDRGRIRTAYGDIQVLDRVSSDAIEDRQRRD
jgi:hypothetical protein